MLADYHMHTEFSDDSTCPMENEIKKAISLGIDEICFTEHVDYGVKTDLNHNYDSYIKGYQNREEKRKKQIPIKFGIKFGKQVLYSAASNCNYNAYVRELQRCKEKYKDQIVIKLGIEFGMQVNTIEQFQNDFNKYEFDFVILSCHQVDNKEFWKQDFQKGKTQQEYNEAYYNEILKVIRKYDDYSVLGHLDMIKRYDKAGNYPFEKTKHIVTEILEYVISHGKGIEVNTSCFRYGLKDLTPSKEILNLYEKLGGTILTIGSDAHEEKDVGYNIPLVKKDLRQIGFKKFCTFKKMEPIFHDL